MNSKEAHAYVVNAKKLAQTDPMGVIEQTAALSLADKFATATESTLELAHALTHKIGDALDALVPPGAEADPCVQALVELAALVHECYTVRRACADRLEDVAA